MSKPIALLGHMHACPRPYHFGGPIVKPGQSFVRVDGIPVAVEGGYSLCTGRGCLDGLSQGSSVVRIEGKGVMRQGDETSHNGRIVQGQPRVKVS